MKPSSPMRDDNPLSDQTKEALTHLAVELKGQIDLNQIHSRRIISSLETENLGLPPECVAFDILLRNGEHIIASVIVSGPSRLACRFQPYGKPEKDARRRKWPSDSEEEFAFFPFTPEILDTGNEDRIREFLQTAVFYPASRLDPRPVIHLSDRFQNFIYVDYDLSPKRVESGLQGPRFTGYKCLQIENLQPEQLLGGSSKSLPAPYHAIAPRITKMPFIKIARFQKRRRATSGSGSKEIRILFICGEALVIYDALFRRRGLVPACLSYLCPGIYEGGNFLDFPPLLAWKFLEKPDRFPQFLFHDYGGMDDKTEDFFPLHPLYLPECEIEPDDDTAPPSVVFHKLMDPLDEMEVKIAQFAAVGAIQMRRFWKRREDERKATR